MVQASLLNSLLRRGQPHPVGTAQTKRERVHVRVCVSLCVRRAAVTGCQLQSADPSGSPGCHLPPLNCLLVQEWLRGSVSPMRRPQVISLRAPGQGRLLGLKGWKKRSPFATCASLLPALDVVLGECESWSPCSHFVTVEKTKTTSPAQCPSPSLCEPIESIALASEC